MVVFKPTENFDDMSVKFYVDKEAMVDELKKNYPSELFHD